MVVVMMDSVGGTATIKTLGQFGGVGTKSMGGPFYSTLYKCGVGLYRIVCNTKEKAQCRDDHWKYLHQSTVFPPDQTASSVERSGEPNFGRAAITR